ncbi:hypothetical protein C9374_010656 [Naegleria lovaniensis]|uniref:Cas1p 10 TM acyl transferase domain-containing protein n=1 Tax=Naegleria lovaniensis TaxID=51637 RepID=A0AA88GFG9_NAELO|nr:uncharacterized protein C9374_010656 [Naegleria lovaniensis]KAG2374637.1 hypothetical protein C9374_010656 [Naegleria lovaniensis]
MITLVTSWILLFVGLKLYKFVVLFKKTIGNTTNSNDDDDDAIRKLKIEMTGLAARSALQEKGQQHSVSNQNVSMDTLEIRNDQEEKDDARSKESSSSFDKSLQMEEEGSSSRHILKIRNHYSLLPNEEDDTLQATEETSPNKTVNDLHHSSSSSLHENIRSLQEFGNYLLNYETLITNLGILGGILLIVYLGHTKNPLLFETTERVYSRDLFISICIISLICGFFTLQKVEKNSDVILSREQTEEWKGWMQLVFLLYHYYNAQELYAPIRVFVSSYVWMSGFGNFSYFYNKGDMSFGRFLQMLWRLNFSAVAFCLVTGNSYFLYYIVPLHTLYFVMIFVVMRIGRPLWNQHFLRIRIKLIVNLLLIYAIWETPSLYHFICAGPRDLWKRYLWTSNLAYHDFYFRTYLDHYSAFFGMLFALNYQSLKDLLNHVHKCEKKGHVVSAGLIVLCSSMIALWCYIYFPTSKFTYNSFHPYFSVVPIMCFVYLRNATPTLRSYYMKSFQFIGVVTLETYLLQHHVLMTDNAKSVLIVRGLSEFPLLNTILVSIVFMILSYQLYHVTIYLRDFIFERVVDWTSVGILFGWCGILYFLIYTLQDFILRKESIFMTLSFIVFLTCLQMIGISAFGFFTTHSSIQSRISIILSLCAIISLFIIHFTRWLFNSSSHVEKEVNGYIGHSYYQGFLIVCAACSILMSGDSLFGVFHVWYRVATWNFSPSLPFPYDGNDFNSNQGGKYPMVQHAHENYLEIEKQLNFKLDEEQQDKI